MKRLLFVLTFAAMAVCAYAQEFNRVPNAWKWINDKEVIFTYNRQNQMCA